MSLATFHSVPTAQMPQSGIIGDIWYDSDKHLIFFVAGDGLLYQLLVAVPIPVQGATGPTGPAGIQGEVGPAFPTTWQYSGTWQPSPVEYVRGVVTSYNGFLYVSLADLNVSLNVLNPQGNPYWSIVGPVNTVRTTELVIVCDGAGLQPNIGFHGFINLPFACQLLGYVLTADQPGSANFDLKFCSANGFPSTASIVNGNFPALVSAQRSTGDTTGYTKTAFVSTDILEIDLLSVTSCTFLSLYLLIAATN